MRKEQLDNWIESGGELPENLEENEKDYLKSLEWEEDREWYGNGQKLSEGYFLHGLRHGARRHWNDSGQLRNEYNYLHGKQHGLNRGWYHNGQLDY